MDLGGAGIEEARRANQSEWIWPVTMPRPQLAVKPSHLDHPCAKKRNKDLSIFSFLSKQHLLSHSGLIFEDRTAEAFCPLSQKALKILTLGGQRVNDGLFFQSAWSRGVSSWHIVPVYKVTEEVTEGLSFLSFMLTVKIWCYRFSTSYFAVISI